MIEINLLPQEFRVPDRTPLGLILTVVIGVCVVSVIGIYEYNLMNELERLKGVQKTREDERTQLLARKAVVDGLKKELTKAQRRQKTIIDISLSKIVWSQKLIQFGRIMYEFPDIWIDRFNLAGGSGVPGTITLGFYALGNDLRKVAAFRERMETDTTFHYHFDRMNAPNTRVSGPGPLASDGYKGETIQFDVTIPVR